tara:strand:+ start:62 stop:679 length:618 start_codon:yes stop_codon:yes gene_type:complete
MEYLFLGFIIGLSIILAIGAQNIFVIEQGLKKQYIFIVCLICSISDLLLIFLGIFLFHYFSQFFNSTIELTFNILLLLFLAYFIYTKIIDYKKNKIIHFDKDKNNISITNIILKTLGFTYLNPHVYSDTVFFLGNFSKNLSITQKFNFGIGASLASFLFFFTIGYLSKFLSRYLISQNIWKIINLFIIIFMSLLFFYIIRQIFYY